MTQTIGQKLKQAREAKRLTLEQVFEAIRIRIPYLKALEDDNLSVMPSPVQARGYLRNYADFLDLNVDQLLEEMRAEKKASDEIIGPADLTDQSASQTSERAPVQQAAPLFTPEPASVIQAESQPEIVPTVDEIPVIKPKTTRRKKADAQPAATETSPTKRRGRKKAEPQPEPTPIVESQPEVIAEPAAAVVPEPEPVIEPVLVEEIVEPQTETTPQQDVNENLWQTWLNRIGSVIASRKSNKKETKSQESLQQPEVVEPENLQPANFPTESEIDFKNRRRSSKRSA
ncbi:MAG: helix-turn-helix domain-containing protein [Anaerolineales bacterium]